MAGEFIPPEYYQQQVDTAKVVSKFLNWAGIVFLSIGGGYLMAEVDKSVYNLKPSIVAGVVSAIGGFALAMGDRVDLHQDDLEGKINALDNRGEL